MSSKKRAAPRSSPGIVEAWRRWRLWLDATPGACTARAPPFGQPSAGVEPPPAALPLAGPGVPVGCGSGDLDGVGAGLLLQCLLLADDLCCHPHLRPARRHGPIQHDSWARRRRGCGRAVVTLNSRRAAHWDLALDRRHETMRRVPRPIGTERADLSIVLPSDDGVERGEVRGARVLPPAPEATTHLPFPRSSSTCVQQVSAPRLACTAPRTGRQRTKKKATCSAPCPEEEPLTGRTWAREWDSWVDVDGAFGLWALAHPGRAHLTDGLRDADSWAVDGHKWLNVPYDCGVALVRSEEDPRPSFASTAGYLPSDAGFEAMLHTPQASQRARQIEVWAVLRSLGRQGAKAPLQQRRSSSYGLSRTMALAGAVPLRGKVAPRCASASQVGPRRMTASPVARQPSWRRRGARPSPGRSRPFAYPPDRTSAQACRPSLPPP